MNTKDLSILLPNRTDDPSTPGEGLTALYRKNGVWTEKDDQGNVSPLVPNAEPPGDNNILYNFDAEYVWGTYIKADGSEVPVYAKSFDINAFVADDTLLVTHGIEDLDLKLKMDFQLFDGENNYEIPIWPGSTLYTRHFTIVAFRDADIRIDTAVQGGADITGYSAYVTLYYTKTAA